MSYSIAVILENRLIPDRAVPEGHRSAGQNLGKLDELDGVAAGLGLVPLGDFLLDHEGLIEDELRKAGAYEPEAPTSAGGPPSPDRDEMVGEIWALAVERAEARWRWFPPSDGLRTIRGLIRALESSPELNERFSGASWDLRDFEYKLEYAAKSGLKFHLC